jgi:tetratricopeptide (TPR) repeat protein
LSDHPTPVEVELFLAGKLLPERARPVVAHLLRGCQRCKALVALHVPAMTGDDETAEPEISPALDAAYDRAIDRALEAVRQHEHKATRERATTKALTARIASKKLAALFDAPPYLRGLPAFESLLEQSWAIRHDNPAEMVRLAMLATLIAGQLNPKRLGAKRVVDLECRARIELGNAYRAADRLDEADSALRLAAELYLEGTGDEQLRARLFDVQASLYADRRQFSRASDALTIVHAIHAKRGDKHLAGRSLVSKGIYTGLANDPEGALRLLGEASILIDHEGDPHLALACIHNTARFMRDCGRLREARTLLFENLWRYEAHGGTLDRLRLKWVQGQINSDLGELGRAERDFLDARKGFKAVGRRYDAAILGLDLSAVWMRQGRNGEAKSVAFEAVDVFLSLGIHREALIAVMILRDAFEMEVATTSLVRSVADFLRRAQFDPSARYEIQFV